MKRIISMFNAAVFALSLTLGAAGAAAAANTFDAADPQAADYKVFPGDKITGFTEIDNTDTGEVYQPDENGVWTNTSTDKVYSMTPGTLDETAGTYPVSISEAGITVVVEHGTSMNADTGAPDTHYVKYNSEEELDTDTAYYAPGTQIIITAAEPEEPTMMFSSWSIDKPDSEAQIEDETAAQTKVTLGNEGLILTANYVPVPEETPMEATADVQPESQPAESAEPAAADQQTVQDTAEPVQDDTAEPVQDDMAEPAPEGEQSPVIITQDLTIDTDGDGIPDAAAPSDTQQSDVPAETPEAQPETQADEEEVPNVQPAAEISQPAEYTADVTRKTVHADGTEEAVQDADLSAAFTAGETVTLTAQVPEGDTIAWTAWLDDWMTTPEALTGTDSDTVTFIMPDAHLNVIYTLTEAQPETPAAKVQPETPAAQVQPETPAAQTQPETPAAQTQPETPAAQTQPETPAAQVQPETPAAEAEPQKYGVTVRKTLEDGTKETDESLTGANQEHLAGDQVSITVDVPNGFKITWDVKNADGTVPEGLTGTDQPAVAFTMPAQAVSADFALQQITYPVSVIQVGLDGSRTAEDTQGKAYAAGENVSLSAAVPEGCSVSWEVLGNDGVTVPAGLTDINQKDISFTMPEQPVTAVYTLKKLPAVSEIQLSDTDMKVAGGDSSSGKLMGTEGQTITVTAPAPDYGYTFAGWSVTNTADKTPVSYSQSGDGMTITFTMPAAAVYVEAKYNELPKYSVTVTKGAGGGTYLAGETVEISADAPQDGWRFKQWTVTGGSVSLKDPKAADAVFLMPSEDVSVKAEYEQIKFKLTVNNGSGDGTYAAGAKVNLTADWPADGKEFAAWKVSGSNASVSGTDRYYANLTMPAADVIVEATYKNGPSVNDNGISGITEGAEYLKGTAIQFTAYGGGMKNSNPNPGDYRYRPTGYQIGSVSGGWSNSSYTTSMAINTPGDYKLTVTYTKDIFDGSSWVSDGTNVTSSVSFHVVSALSVETGDTNPILPMAVAAGAALIVIIVLVVLKARKKNK